MSISKVNYLDASGGMGQDSDQSSYQQTDDEVSEEESDDEVEFLGESLVTYVDNCIWFPLSGK